MSTNRQPARVKWDATLRKQVQRDIAKRLPNGYTPWRSDRAAPSLAHCPDCGRGVPARNTRCAACQSESERTRESRRKRTQRQNARWTRVPCAGGCGDTVGTDGRNRRDAPTCRTCRTKRRIAQEEAKRARREAA